MSKLAILNSANVLGKMINTLSEDERVVLINDPSELPIFTFVQGIIMPFRFAAATERQLLEIAAQKNKWGPEKDFKSRRDISKYDASQDPALKVVGDAIDELTGYYNLATGGINTTPPNSTFRVNSYTPQGFHEHGAATLTYSVSGTSTMGENKDGVPYETPERHIFIFKNLRHKAPLPDPDPEIIRGTFFISAFENS